MRAAAHSLPLAATDQTLVSFQSFGLRAVERKMREVTRADTVVAPVQLAVRHHLEGGGARRRARLALAAADLLSIGLEDAVALAACVELLHHATLLRDEAHNRVAEREGRPAVWAEFGDDIAVSAGDVLVSAAYASAATVSDGTSVAELARIIHAAVATGIDGRAKDLALENVFVSDYAVYERVATDKAALRLGLPLELLLAFKGHEDATRTARTVAEQLAIAQQIAEDLEDARRDSTSDRDSGCLNVVTVLKNMGNTKPVEVASANAYAALRKSISGAEKLPCGTGECLSPTFETVFDKIQAALR